MDRQTNNELIAIFMGWSADDRYQKSGDFQVWTSKEAKNAILASYLDYDKNWNMLMPVVKKIYSLGYNVDINSNLRRVNVYKNDIGLMSNAPDYNSEFRGNKSHNEDVTDIGCLFSAIVEFVNFYNEHNNK